MIVTTVYIIYDDVLLAPIDKTVERFSKGLWPVLVVDIKLNVINMVTLFNLIHRDPGVAHW